MCVRLCVLDRKGREKLHAGVWTCENCSTQKAGHMAEQEAASFDVSEVEERGRGREG